MRAAAPPRVAAALLSLVAPSDDRASLLADLEEEFTKRAGSAGPTAARRWYWRETFSSLAPLGRRRLELAVRVHPRRWHVTSRAASLSGIPNDLRHAWRLARRAPVVSLSIIAAVALGIAATTAIVSVMEGVFLRPLPFPAASDLVSLGTSVERFGHVPEVNFRDAEDWRRASTALSSIASYDVESTAVRLDPGVSAVSATVLAAGLDLDRVLGVRADIGRWFAPAEQAFGGPSVVLLGHRFWRSRFGADSAVVGRSIDVGARRCTIVGVLPASADRFPPGGADLWVPLTFPPTSFLNLRGSMALPAVGRLRPGASLAAARDELTAIALRLTTEYPETNAQRGAVVEGLQDAMVGPVRPLMLLLAAALVLLLAVACSNIASLLLAHAHARSREFNIRMAVGATRARVLRQLWTENLVLFGCAGTAGIVLAGPLARAVVARYPGHLPLVADIQIDGRVLLAACFVTVCAMLLAGLPQARRLGALGMAGGMNDGVRAGIAPGHRRVAAGFVVAQVALSTVLLVGGLLLLRTFINLTAIEPGFHADGIVTMRASIPESLQKSAAVMVAFQDQLRDAAAALPGVEGAAHAMFIPFAPGSWGDGFRLPDQSPSASGEPFAHFYMVSPEYLRLLGLTIVRGRGLAAADLARSPRVLVVSERFAASAFPGREAVGQRIRWNDDVWEVVGVTGDVRHTSFWESPDADAYVPRAQVPRAPTWLLIKTGRPAEVIARELSDRMKGAAPGLALTDASSLDRRLAEATAPERFRALVTGAIASLSLVLAVVGLYSVVAYDVARRTREIGVRRALGAQTATVWRGILAESGRTVAAGLIPGVVVSLLLARWLVSQGVVQASVAGTISAVVVMLCTSAFVAALVPAVRAGRVNPIEALRQD